MSEDIIKKSWDEKASFWQKHVGAKGDSNRQLNLDPTLWEMLGEVKGQSILDAGCGTGYLTYLLAEKGAKVWAVDLSDKMVAIAKENCKTVGENIRFETDDCSKLSTIESESMDKVVSIFVLQDLPDLEGACKAIRRVLKTGGEAIVINGHPCVPPNGPIYGDKGFSFNWPFGYFEQRECREVWSGTDLETGRPFEFPSEFIYFHRPLSVYWKTFKRSGFALEDFDEPVVRSPYPDDLDKAQLKRYLDCPFSFALKLRAI